MRNRRPHCTGFTMVDLLFLLGTVLLLGILGIGVILPRSPGNPKVWEGATRCQANMYNTLALGMKEYMATTGTKHFPSPYESPGAWYKMDPLDKEYTEGSYRCPGDKTFPHPGGPGGKPFRSSYSCNYWIADLSAPSPVHMFNRTPEFHRRPGNVILFGESDVAKYAVRSSSNAVDYAAWFPSRHAGFANYLMFDLSVQEFRLPDRDSLECCNPAFSPNAPACMPFTSATQPHWCYYNRDRISYIDELYGRTEAGAPTAAQP